MSCAPSSMEREVILDHQCNCKKSGKGLTPVLSRLLCNALMSHRHYEVSLVPDTRMFLLLVQKAIHKVFARDI